MSTSQNSPLRPGQPGNEIKEIVRPLPSEPVTEKLATSASIGYDLESQLRAAKIDTLIIVGIAAEHCVSTTTRMAANLGFTTFVVSDATASFESTGADGEQHPAELVHKVSSRPSTESSPLC
jgi:nicotinamidase-related amidase